MESPKSYTLRAKKQELIKIKEELRKAKENATQSWIDSRPLIDELERRKSNLEILKNKTSVPSSTLVPELENELETTNAEIKSTKKEELEVTKQADEITRALDHVREEMETLKRFAGSKKQKKLKMKRVLRLRRQRLRSLQLRIEAARKELEAYVESREEALRYLTALETLMANGVVLELDHDHDYDHNHDRDQVQVLSHEEYMALKKRVDEENSLADWRVSVAEEQKNEAKKSRDFAMAKLRELKLAKTAMRRKEVGEREEDLNVVGEEDDIGRVVEDDENKEGDKRYQVIAAIPTDQSRKKNKDYQELEEKRPEKSAKKKKQKKKMTKKKKKSIFWQMKQCFVSSIIRRLFG